MIHLVQQEPWMNYLLSEFQDNFKEKAVIDVGVNIGQTLLKVKSIVPDCTYIGFEPNPHCQSYLMRLIEINKLSNTTIVPVAIANKIEVLELLFDNASPIDSSAGIINSYRKGTKRKINVLSLDPARIEGLKEKKTGLIKIDVEGAELEVLKGFYEIIEKNKPIIIIEILPVYSIENKERLDRQIQLQELITSLDYEIYRVNETTSTRHLIKELEIHSDLSICNYVLKPRI